MGEEETECYDSWGKYFVGDCVSYAVEGVKNIELQGVIFSIVKNELGEIWFELNLLQRAPPSDLWDINEPNMKVYRYIDTDEMQWVKEDQVLCTVPLQCYPEDSKRLNKGVVRDSAPAKERQLMIYYKEGPRGVPGIPMKLKMLWYHFDPESFRTLEWRGRRCMAMDDDDITLGFCCYLKGLIFDPLVSPYSYSHRHAQPHWNIRTWKLLLRFTKDKTIDLNTELQKLRESRPEEIIRKDELFLGPKKILNFLLVILNEWANLDPREVSVYEAVQYASHHADVIEKLMQKISSKAQREAEAQDSTDSEESDLDEHESFGGGGTEEGSTTYRTIEEEGEWNSDESSSLSSSSDDDEGGWSVGGESDDSASD
jgi:hypothetical protein